MKFSIAAPGLKELQKELKKLPDEISVKFVKQAMTKAVKPIVTRATAAAPVDTGRLQMLVGVSARIVKGIKGRQDRVDVRVGPLVSSKRQIANKLKKKAEGKIQGTVLTSGAWYGHFVEYGTTSQPAQPFLRPAFDAGKEEFIATFTAEVREKLDRYYAKLPNTRK